MRFAGAVAALMGTATAEKVWLQNMKPFPDSHTLEVMHFFTVKEASDLNLLGPVTVASVPPKGLQIAVMSSNYVETLMKNVTFCGSDGQLVASDEVYAYDISDASLQKGYANDKKTITKPGVYYVMLGNCGDSTGSAVQFTGGEIAINNKNGWLPGEEYPKMAFYGILALVYLVLTVVWGIQCSVWRDVLFKTHWYVAAALFMGVFEATCWYASYYHWNYIGHRWWSMIILAAISTVVKQGVCYSFLLLACEGVGVTKERIENTKFVKLVLVIMGFILTDGFRLVMMISQNRIESLNTWVILAVVTPGSFFVSIIYVWVMNSLQDTIAALESSKQLVKLEVFKNLRLSLGATIVCAICAITYETVIVRRTELQLNWETRWVFTDALSHCIFAFLTAVVMFLWRPNESSKQMAYSVQLGDGEGVEMQANDPESAEAEVTLE